VRYHPRFDSNAWVWPTGPIEKEINNGKVLALVPPQMSGPPVVLFDKMLTAATADPWFIVYADNRGGVSAATWVVDDADKGVYAFYNTRLLDSWDIEGKKISLKKLMDPREGTPFSPREETMASLWNTLTTVASPSYEGLQDLDTLIRGETITYFASHPIPQSINKLHIGG
jgi:hypothetical protein